MFCYEWKVLHLWSLAYYLCGVCTYDLVSGMLRGYVTLVLKNSIVLCKCELVT